VTTQRDPTSLYKSIRDLVLSARRSVARGGNLLQVYTNYEIGRRIFMQEQRGDRVQYGEEIIWEVTTNLTEEFGSGLSKINLEYMRRFYLTYPERIPQIAQTASGQLEGVGGQSQPPFSLS